MDLDILKNKIQNLSQLLTKLDYEEVFTYHVFDYAFESFWQYFTKYGKGRKSNLFLGINPGYYGMTQTGIPFGTISIVRDWLSLADLNKRPKREHIKRKIYSHKIFKEEESGLRLWGFFKYYYKRPELFFKDNFVYSFCPSNFLDYNGRNITPDKLKKEIRLEVEKICLEMLSLFLEVLKPVKLLAISRYIENILLKEGFKNVYYIQHPSPLSHKSHLFWSDFSLTEKYLKPHLTL